MKKILITGSARGLGQYLKEVLKGEGFDRGDTLPKKADIIIHCAFNSARAYQENPDKLLLEDIALVKKLIAIPHSYFVFISSIEALHPDNSYAFAKVEAEKLVKKNTGKYLILRPSAMLGMAARINSLLKIIEGNCKLTVTADSVFNYVLHWDVADFIKFAIRKKLNGAYQLASSENITLENAEKIARQYLGRTNIEYGDFRYDCGNIDITETLKTGGFLEKTSAEVVD